MTIQCCVKGCPHRPISALQAFESGEKLYACGRHKYRLRPRVLGSFGPENPWRFNPDHWWRDIDGVRTWVGPCSGVEWRERYGTLEWEGVRKPFPSNIHCWFTQCQVHHEVCAARRYEGCNRCSIPSKLIYRIWVERKAVAKAESILFRIRIKGG